METNCGSVESFSAKHIFGSIVERNLEVSSTSIKIPHKYDLPVSKVLSDANIQIHKRVLVYSVVDGK